MANKAEFLMCQGDSRATKKFLIEYQRCILFTLESEGILDRHQREECVLRLEKSIGTDSFL